MSTRVDYGIDAPGVVRNLFVGGIACIVVGILVQLATTGVAEVIGAVITGFGPWYILSGCLMIYSSKVGKYIVRERLIDLVELNGTEQVLDAGCGRGLILHGAARRLTTGRATGVDIWQARDQSRNNREETLRNAELEGVSDKVEVVNADMRDLPFSDASFDAILSCLAIHNIPTDAGRGKAITEFLRVLRPGGRFALLDFQKTKEYVAILTAHGVENVQRKIFGLLMFPPVWVVTGRKPA